MAETEVIIDLKATAFARGPEKVSRPETYITGPRQVTSELLLNKILDDFTKLGPQFQNVVFMVRLALRKRMCPPYRVFIDDWPDYEVVNVYRDRNSAENDDQSTVVYRGLDKLVETLSHTNLRHVYARPDRQILLRGVKEEHFAEFRSLMSRAGFQMYNFSEPYRIMCLYEEKKLAEYSDRSSLYKEIPLSPESAEFGTVISCLPHVSSLVPDIPPDQITDYVRNFPSVAIQTKSTNKLVAFALTTSTGAMDHVHVLPRIYDRELRSHVIISLVVRLKAGRWLDKPFLEVTDADPELVRFYQKIGFRDMTGTRRRALRIQCWGRPPPRTRSPPAPEALIEIENQDKETKA